MIGLWECNKVKVIRVTISALGMVHIGLEGWLKKIDIKKN